MAKRLHLLIEHCILVTHDQDASREFLSRVWEKHRTVLRSRQFAVRWHQANLRHTSLAYDCPTGSGNQMTLFEVAKEISGRLSNIFKLDKNGRRPVFGSVEKFRTEPHRRDHVLFCEYFHGDGSGIGASHQAGWTGCAAKVMQLFASVKLDEMLRDLGPAGVLYEGPRVVRVKAPV